MRIRFNCCGSRSQLCVGEVVSPRSLTSHQTLGLSSFSCFDTFVQNGWFIVSNHEKEHKSWFNDMRPGCEKGEPLFLAKSSPFRSWWAGTWWASCWAGSSPSPATTLSSPPPASSSCHSHSCSLTPLSGSQCRFGWWCCSALRLGLAWSDYFSRIALLFAKALNLSKIILRENIAMHW